MAITMERIPLGQPGGPQYREVAGWRNPSKALVEQLVEQAERIQFHDLWMGQGPIVKEDRKNLVRIDNQGPFHLQQQDGWNIQAQVKNVSLNAIGLIRTLQSAQGNANQQAVVTKVREALKRSAEEGYWYVVGGTSP